MTTTTYESDFYLWTQQQTALLRQGALSSLDVEHLIEEIESMGNSNRFALESYVSNVLIHLLKWQYQPERRGSSWRLSIRNGRRQIGKRLKNSPSLKPQLPTIVQEEYLPAREDAADETGLPLTTFPDQCPFTLDQITGDWWPE
jgi:hypothetical protein